VTKPTLASIVGRLPSSDWKSSGLAAFTPNRIKIEILAGLTVALALVPEAVAFAFVAGVHPLVGLYAAFIVGLITALAGGRPGMISGATGALAVVMVALVAQHGVEYLFATVVLMGILQLLAGAFRLGKFIRLVPHPVMLGFVNGLAIVIFLAQISQFQVTNELVPIDTATLEIIFPYAVILAAIGLIESLLTLNIVGEMTGKRGGASQECMAQGLANTVTGFFGGMGGCAMIGQSMINVKSGGRTRLSAFAAAAFLLLFIMAASNLIEQIPLAALVGVMFMVVIGTFAWQSLRIMLRIPLSDAFVIVLVTGVTVMYDLAIAVVVGVIVSALSYAWTNARRIHALIDDSKDGVKVYKIEGPLFFGSTEGFAELFMPESDPNTVIVDFMDSRVADQSALQAIEDMASRYQALGKTLQLRHLSRDCHKLLNRAGQLMVDSNDDPDYGIAVEYSVQTGILGGEH
jgi:SulP family sulfate permease